MQDLPDRPRAGLEDGSASGTGTEGQKSPSRIRLQIETISDVVFGLALEIGSVSLVAKLPPSGIALTGDIVAFAFSFVVVFMAWFAYRRLTAALPHETEGTLVVNVALLFCASIEPFLFYVLVVGSDGVAAAASVALSLDLGALMLLLSTLHYLLVRENQRSPHTSAHPRLLEDLRITSVGRVFAGATFLGAALPMFSISGPFGLALREELWCAALALFLGVQWLTRHSTAAGKPSRDLTVGSSAFSGGLPATFVVGP